MRTTLFICVLFLGCTVLQAQDTTRGSNKRHWLYHRSGMGALEESSIELVPEVSFFKNFGYGLGISKTKFVSDGLGAFGHGFNAGYSYLSNQKTSVLHVSAWMNANIVLVGFYAGARVQYFTGSHYDHFALRPELGYGFYRFNVFYAYSFIFGQQPESFRPGSINASVYIPLLRGKEIPGKIQAYD